MYLPPMSITNPRHLRVRAFIAIVAWLALSIQFTSWRFLDGDGTRTLAGVAAGISSVIIVLAIARYRRGRSEP